MSKYPFPQIDNQILSQDHDAKAQVYKHTPSLSNKGIEQNLITRKETATLADFVVMLAQNRIIYSFTRKPKNQTQGRSLQLVERGI